MARYGRLRSAFCVLVMLIGITRLAAAEPQIFPDAKAGSGELRHVGTVPLAIVRGTPEEIGTQLGGLLGPSLAFLAERREAMVEGFLGVPAAPLLLKAGNLMLDRFPADYRVELAALSKASGVSYDFLVFGNVVYDVSKVGGCAALMVEPARSKTGGVLMGRNMDFPTFGFLDRIGLVVVYRPQGKHAFASVTFPGFVGCLSGMNDAGLCVAQLEVNTANDGSPRFDFRGTPLAMCFRRVLEDCATIDEAEKLLNTIKRTSMCNMAICDRRYTAVFEITTKSIVRRPAPEGMCACTNHFRTADLATSTECRRYRKLAQYFETPKLGLADVAARMDDVHQGEMTIQTMVFEPESLTLHLALGSGPVTAKPLEKIALAPLLKPAP